MTGEKTPRTVIKPERKIKVFISSICGDKAKYDRVRAELKEAIESTNLAEVYLFEDRGASTLTAGSHYTWALEDSDVCIFLIDNADGVTAGVQKEGDTARRCNIKSIYYFWLQLKIFLLTRHLGPNMLQLLMHLIHFQICILIFSFAHFLLFVNFNNFKHIT